VKHGVLLFAHGARDANWAEPFERVAEQLRGLRPDAEVALAYLEFMVPDLIAAGTALAQRGCSRIDVVPLFLGAGGHVRKDVPALFAALVERHPGVQWQLQRAIGQADEVIAAMARCAAQLIASPGAKGAAP
jgi:sirohydrochlorin cobaltochelatase